MRIVAYTAVIGNHASPHVQPLPSDVPMICFTDNPGLRVDGYDMRVVDSIDPDPGRAARFLKIMAHRAVPGADWAIWFDTSVIFKTARLSGLVHETASAGASIAVHPHAVRDCVYDEAAVCKTSGFDAAGLIDTQVARYRELGHPPAAGLWENGLVVRRLADPGVVALNEAWWDEVTRGSGRDQLSLPVVLRQLSVAVHPLAGTVYDDSFAAVARGSVKHRPVSFVERIQRRWQTPRMRLNAEHVDAAFYRAMNPDVDASGLAPQDHFDRYGCAEGRAPHAMFDATYFGGTYADYLDDGWRRGRDPHPLFDTSFYLEANPDVARAGHDPLSHFLSAGAREARDPHVLFDGTQYRARHGDAVRAVFGGALGHYLTRGWREGCQPNGWFSPSSYLRRYPDVAAAGIEPFCHYLRDGIRDGRN